MRTAFVNQLLQEAERDGRVFLIVGDLGYHVVEPFAQRFPQRFLNAGIAEQNMLGVAAGLSATGCNVFVYSIGNFPTLRCLEQIRNDVAYHRCNVKIVAVGAGYAYGSLGATHQATEDIAAMRAMPNLAVCTPGDPAEAAAVASLAAAFDGPMYIRLGKAGEKNVHSEPLPEVALGDILLVRRAEGARAAVLACGSILHDASRQIEEQGLPYDLYSVPFVKPINRDRLAQIARCHPDGLITLEEHQRSGGMGAAVVEQLNDLYAQGALRDYPKVRRLAIPDVFAPVVGNQQYLRAAVGLRL